MGDVEGYSAVCKKKHYNLLHLQHHIALLRKKEKKLFQKGFSKCRIAHHWACDSGSIDRARGALKPFLQTHSKGTALFIQTEDLDYGMGHVTSHVFFTHLSPVL